MIELLHGTQPEPSGARRQDRVRLSRLQARLDAVETRLAATEQRVGTGPDTSDLDGQIDRVSDERHAAADAQEYERAASLRDEERQLLVDKAARQEQWEAEHPGLPSLAEQSQQLSGEVARLRSLLRQHGIDPEDKPA
ncbi:MAG TPA: UvrB/UvrC motif-containing protein [Streptosporangiaceae bacterium]